MKFGATIKSAILFSILAVGVQGTASAQAGPGGGPHIRIFNGSSASAQHKPVVTPRQDPRPQTNAPGSVAAKQRPPQPIGLLLPAVQKVH